MHIYSKRQLRLHTVDSLLFADKVFVGSQPDDLSFCNLLSQNEKVLLLGGGLGGAIRALQVVDRPFELTLVDNNRRTLSIAQLLHEEYFPTLPPVKYLCGDAKIVIQSYVDYFDVICVDLYTEEGYPSFTMSHQFWSHVSNALREGGTAIINAFGLPNHLNPLEGESVQKEFIRIVQQEFGQLRGLPHRRNITLFASKTSQIQLAPTNVPKALQGLDELFFLTMQKRWMYSDLIPEITEVPSSIKLTKEHLNLEMSLRWPKFVDKINCASQMCGMMNITKENLRELFQRPIHAIKIQEQLLQENSRVADFIPICVGMFGFGSPFNLKWYADWLYNESLYLYQNYPKWFVNVALVQLIAYEALPFAPSIIEESKLKSMIIQLNL